MRVFIAINIDAGIRKALGDLQLELQSKVDIKRSDVKWVNPENMHLTLKFLGEIKDEKVVEVCNVVRNVAGRHSSFELDVGSVGHFGGRSARVLWVGCGHGCDGLGELQKDIDKQLAAVGWPEDKRAFTGHLTLCRVRNPNVGVRLAQSSEAYKDVELGSVWADSVTVYESRLRSAGPVYVALGNFKLQKGTRMELGENRNG